MTLADLLDTLRVDILHDTSDQVAGDSDQLWSDTRLIRYIDQAQRRFARRTLCILDGTSPVTRFSTVPLQRDYTLDPSILTVKSIRGMGNGAYVNGGYLPGAFNADGVFVLATGAPIYPDSHDLRRVSHAAGRRRLDDDAPFDVNAIATQRTGRPAYFETDETSATSGGSAGVVTLSLYPMPAADYSPCVMQTRVTRLPVARLTGKDMSAVPEIPEDYHLDMLDYAAYLALRIVDHEAGDPQRALEYQQSFDRHVVEARQEIERKQFQPMGWGFGGGGFGYTPN